MLTLFTVPKAFTGHINIIQRNAIKSWTLLRPECEIFLAGDDEGTAEAARDLGVKHIPQVARNEFGTPFLDSAFKLVETKATYPIICHINADIILMNDFMDAVCRVITDTDHFLMTARRWELNIMNFLEFEPGWEANLRSELHERGKLSHSTGIDFWVYSKGIADDMPPFAVGRIATESWLLYRARVQKSDLIDCTPSVISIHQNHDYSHHPEGLVGVGRGVEAQRNRELVGGKRYFFTIRDRTHVLTSKNLKLTRDAWWIWRTVRTSGVLYPTMPILLRWASRLFNVFIDSGRDFMIIARGLIRNCLTKAKF